ncbi:hypothetical protein JTE90_019855 [Oedothorax gibbosus]|uniref:Uncharacterized protein n=1 Tax=Oedothorax gibbosus TaxID=931172 RepID=A0AAV6VYL3_9ARAC|nr:hypothetical protein JTE90_019855 [Oedothorax gibbosus]
MQNYNEVSCFTSSTVSGSGFFRMCLEAIALRDRPPNELLAMRVTCVANVACDVRGPAEEKADACLLVPPKQSPNENRPQTNATKTDTLNL